MLIAKQIEIRNNIKTYFDSAYEGEVIIVPRKQGKNVVIISEKEYLKWHKEHIPVYYSKLQEATAKRGNEEDNDSDAKSDNLKRIEEISALKDNWNGNGAQAFPSALIKKTRALIKTLSIQPEIFPTALETIQLEFDNRHNDHMEIEIGLSGEAEVFVAPYDDYEYTETISSTPASINERVVEFYG